MSAKDDFLIVLDFLPIGKGGDRRSEPVAQGIGDKFFSLLEVVMKDGVTVKPKERVYIGEAKREQVKYIRSKISFKDLTILSKDRVEEVVTELVSMDEKRFVEFFNKAAALTTRMHSLELLPGIGKKHLWTIISERKKKPFETFEEIKTRIPMVGDPKRMVIKRVLEELEEKDRHQLFVSPMMV